MGRTRKPCSVCGYSPGGNHLWRDANESCEGCKRLLAEALEWRRQAAEPTPECVVAAVNWWGGWGYQVLQHEQRGALKEAMNTMLTAVSRSIPLARGETYAAGARKRIQATFGRTLLVLPTRKRADDDTTGNVTLSLAAAEAITKLSDLIEESLIAAHAQGVEEGRASLHGEVKGALAVLGAVLGEVVGRPVALPEPVREHAVITIEGSDTEAAAAAEGSEG